MLRSTATYKKDFKKKKKVRSEAKMKKKDNNKDGGKATDHPDERMLIISTNCNEPVKVVASRRNGHNIKEPKKKHGSKLTSLQGRIEIDSPDLGNDLAHFSGLGSNGWI